MFSVPDLKDATVYFGMSVFNMVNVAFVAAKRR